MWLCALVPSYCCCLAHTIIPNNKAIKTKCNNSFLFLIFVERSFQCCKMFNYRINVSCVCNIYILCSFIFRWYREGSFFTRVQNYCQNIKGNNTQRQQTTTKAAAAKVVGIRKRKKVQRNEWICILVPGLLLLADCVCECVLYRILLRNHCRCFVSSSVKFVIRQCNEVMIGSQ